MYGTNQVTEFVTVSVACHYHWAHSGVGPCPVSFSSFHDTFLACENISADGAVEDAVPVQENLLLDP
jgi:hypothetical protein